MHVIAIVGSYRKNGTVDTVIDEVLAAARQSGAETSKIYLIDRHIAFCTNCRQCTQEQCEGRGACPLADDMGAVLDAIERSDALVLGTSINFYTVTAVMKTFAERLLCYDYWPWGMLRPKMRNKKRDKRAVIVISSAAPAIMTRFLTGAVRLMKDAAAMLGCRTIGVLTIGLAATAAKMQPRPRILKQARRLGAQLARGPD
jgi:multimeric flavodoxin WrbA